MTRSAPRRPGAEGRAAGGTRSARRRMLAAQRRAEERLARVWAGIEARIRAMVPSLLEDDASAARILGRIRAEVLPTASTRLSAIVSGAHASASAGHEGGASVPERAFGELGLPIARRIAAGRTSDDAMALATRYLEGASAVGGIPLSARLHDRSEATMVAMAAELRDGIVGGLSVERLAQALFEVEDVRVALPRYVTDLQAAVRGGDRARLRATVREHLAGADRMSDPTLRAAARRLVRTARRATEEDLDRQVSYWVRDRALYTERVVARTETARVFEAAFTESTREQPWVKGYRWNLSGSHPAPDICDLFANQAIDGLGPGGYEASAVPSTPAHPNCLCYLTAIIDDGHFERELAAARGEEPPPETWRDPRRETASEWLRRQPEAFQRQVLGPGRHAVWSEHPERVIGPRGTIRPLWQVEGRGRPPPRARVHALASERDPFREAGSRSPARTEPEPTTPAPEVPGAREGYRYTAAQEAIAGPALSIEAGRAELRSAVGEWLGVASTAAGPTDAGARVRRTVRGVMRSSGVLSRDVTSELSGASTLRLMLGQSFGAHHIRDGWIAVNMVTRAALASSEFGDILSRRTRGAATAADDAIGTLFHEELHGASTAGRDTYIAYGRVIEEGCVELLSRRFAAMLTGRDRIASGCYDRYIRDLVASLPASYRGRVESDEARVDRIGDAWIAMLQRGPSEIETAPEYARALAAHLPDATDEERDEWNRRLRLMRP